MLEPIELVPRKTSLKLEAERHARERAQHVAALEREERKRRDRQHKGSKDSTSAGSSGTITPADLGQLVDFDKRDDQAQVELLNSERFGGLQGLARTLHTDLERGLSPDDDHAARRKFYGSNVIPLPEPVGLLQLVWENLGDRILQILLVGALINLVFGMIFDGLERGWIEGTAIMFAVSIVVIVTSGNNWLKERKFRAIFLLQSKRQVKVKRNSKTDTVDSSEIMVGDVVELASGDEVPADGVLISGNRFSVEESALTGETVPVKKSETRPFMFAGTATADGMGFMIVTAVGPRSTAGQIQALLNEQRKEATPLQEKLAKMAKEVGFFGISLASLTFFVLTIRWMVVTYTADEFYTWGDFEEVVRAFVLAVTLVVVAVPEGLPLAVTISLAYSMQKMIQDNNFVRHLAASETMGEVTTICSDKTGTLTENRMTVVKSFIGNTEDVVVLTADVRSLFSEGVAINATADLEDADSKTPILKGNKTEGAMLLFCYKQFNADYKRIREQLKKEAEIPFSSARKRMSTAVRKNGQLVLHCKGAAEILLEMCSLILDAQGREQPMTPELKKSTRELVDNYASSGLRTLTLAYRLIPDSAIASDATLQEAETSLILLGIVGIKDPVRPEVPPAVTSCQGAGVRVRMVTGDNVLTAKHIARECGILTDGLVYEGPVFRTLSRQQMDEVLPKLQVLARSSPQDKFLLVSRLKELGEVVAVTGDGTNDGLALKEADVGISMGIAGTDIAKNASDIVLLDDNFRSIVRAILWGRNVFNSIRKFLQFQLGVNVIAIVLTIVGAVSRGAAPLRPVQLLWVNLIMDTFGALALATDPPSPSLLTQPPHKRHENIVTPSMLIYIAGMLIYQLTVLFIILFAGHRIFNVDYNDFRSVHTYVFCVFVFMQVINKLHARFLHGDINIVEGITKNPRFLVLLGCIVVIQTIVIMFAGDFMFTNPMNGREWGIAVAFILPTLGWGWIIRFAIRIYERHYPVHSSSLMAISL